MTQDPGKGVLHTSYYFAKYYTVYTVVQVQHGYFEKLAVHPL